MSMRWLYLPLIFGLTGCTSTPPVKAPVESVENSTDVDSSRQSESVVMTRYELGDYRFPKVPFDRRETAVYRTTRVPGIVAEELERAAAHSSEWNSGYVPPSIDPLPPSVELEVELTTQKRITEEMRAIEKRMSAMEKQVRDQYDVLVRQTDETVALRDKLEERIARLNDAEESSGQSAGPDGSDDVLAPSQVGTNEGEMTW